MRLSQALCVGVLCAAAGSCQTVTDEPATQADISSQDWLTAKAEIYRDLALRSLRGGDPDRTRRLLTEAVQFEEGDVRSIQMLARLNLASGELSEARSCVYWWLRLEPSSISGLCLAGIVEESLGNVEEAEALYRRAMALDEDNAQPLVDLHTFLLNNDRVAEAQTLRTLVCERFPDCYEVLLDHGAYLEAQGDWDGALDTLLEVRLRRPKDLDLAVRVGTAALMLGRVEEVQALESELPPHARLENLSLALVLSAARLRSGDEAGVLQELDLLEGAARRDPVMSLLRGELLLGQRDLSGAEAAFREAVRLDDELARAHAGLGRVYLFRGQPDAARRSLQRCVELDPRGVESRALFAACLAQVGDMEGAREHLKVARLSGRAPQLVAEVDRRFPHLAIEEPQSNEFGDSHQP